ncbi:MAG: 2-aminoethylphosphonate--pyruvate transaminase [Clostridiales bacterium]|nr:2-aminoethylphosphonate--pyruvate transaminase [Clostridiales bacterium]
MQVTIPDNPYLLLTPGPLSTSPGVRGAMLRDFCTWDDDYNREIVQVIREKLVKLASQEPENLTAVLMQGSGTFAVESCLGTAVPRDGKLLVLSNGAYGERMAEIARRLDIQCKHLRYGETQQPDLAQLQQILHRDKRISHVAVVHCETTTGILNPVGEIAEIVAHNGRSLIVDAMSSFGGISIDMNQMGSSSLISSSNKCIQGTPGFAFVLCNKRKLAQCRGNARSLSLDLYDQWAAMDDTGKWRFTSPTHVVRAFYQALIELEEEGGVEMRNRRYLMNQQKLSRGMQLLRYEPLLPLSVQSPIITSFLYPDSAFDFNQFYHAVKAQGFVLYPGKISQADTFRIGNIGHVFSEDIDRLLDVVRTVSIKK